ncbi:MAG: hypothetical protein KZQ83_04185 [gamma proteobacterium symbiont of Taylorina sp.]|nr:hypothetical protein [gamma proteobacterium symbiont of Taylorina sp.]
MKYKTLYAVAIFILCLISTNSYARIKLITLPAREHIEIQLENENITIIEEERIVPLQKGNNLIDFSWHNTSIKPETIIFRVIEGKDQPRANILSVSYPPNEAALTWIIASDKNGSAIVRITYVINHLDKEYHYIAKTNADETLMDLNQYIKVINQSGEEYLNAQMNTGLAKTVSLPMRLNETQEFLNYHFENIPVDKTYTVNAAELGYRNRTQDKLNVLMHYQIHNDTQHNLGKQSLAPGKFRIYQQDKKGSLVFAGEDWGQYTAKGDKEKLYIGQARDIVVKRIIKRKNQQKINGNLKNMDILLEYTIENFKDEEVTIIIEESLEYLRNEVLPSRSQYQLLEWQVGKETNFDRKPIKERSNAQTIAYAITLPARKSGEKVVKLTKKLNINLKNEW